MKVPVSVPYIGKLENNYVNKALKAKAISGFFGDYLPKFESSFSKFCDCKYGIAVSNGTTALHLALDTVGIKKGDEVIVPAITNMATYFSVIYLGAKPVPVDINSDTFNINPSLIEKSITNKTKAIIVVHLFGMPVDMQPVMKIVKKYNLKLIEDCAEAHGAKYKNKKVGSFGDIGCFSFYANKIITTGEGGMLTTNNKKYALKAKNLKELAFGKTNKFIHSDIGYNYRLTNLQAAIGCAQTEQIEKIIKNKKAISRRYKKLIVNEEYFILPKESKDFVNVYWMYLIILRDEFSKYRNYIMKELKRCGIETREGFVSATLQDTFIEKKIINKSNRCIEAEKASFNAFYLPSSVNLSLKEQKYVCDALNMVMSKIISKL